MKSLKCALLNQFKWQLNEKIWSDYLQEIQTAAHWQPWRAQVRMNDHVLPTIRKRPHLQYFQKLEARIRWPRVDDLKSSDRRLVAQTSTGLNEVKMKLALPYNEHRNRPRDDNAGVESKRTCPQQHPKIPTLSRKTAAWTQHNMANLKCNFYSLNCWVCNSVHYIIFGLTQL